MSATTDDTEADAYADRLPAQLAALDAGESLFKGRRYELGTVTADFLRQRKRDLRNDASAAIARAKKRANKGALFLAEVGDFRTESNDLIVCVVITRKA